MGWSGGPKPELPRGEVQRVPKRWNLMAINTSRARSRGEPCAVAPRASRQFNAMPRNWSRLSPRLSSAHRSLVKRAFRRSLRNHSCETSRTNVRFLFSIFHHMLFHFPRLLGDRLRAVSKCLHISIFSYFLACDSRRSSYFSFPCRVLDSRWVVQAQHCYEDIHTFLSRGHGPSAAL